jgi:hypothetical protein
MRTTLLLASLAGLTVTALQNHADACGPYGGIRPPAVYPLTTHHIHDGGTWSARSFALLNQAPEVTPAWRQLAPGTYDYTMIAEAKDLDAPAELTLVGPAGTRVVSTRSRVFLEPELGWRHTATSALELNVAKGEYVIALSGRHTDTRWHGLEGERDATAVDRAWVEQQTLAAKPSYVYVSKVKGTNLETVSVITTGGEVSSFLRSGKVAVRQFSGTIKGAITFGGEQFVLHASRDGAVRAVRI